MCCGTDTPPCAQVTQARRAELGKFPEVSQTVVDDAQLDPAPWPAGPPGCGAARGPWEPEEAPEPQRGEGWQGSLEDEAFELSARKE